MLASVNAQPAVTSWLSFDWAPARPPWRHPVRGANTGEKSLRYPNVNGCGADKRCWSDTYDHSSGAANRGILGACRGPKRANRGRTGEDKRHSAMADLPPDPRPALPTPLTCRPTPWANDSRRLNFYSSAGGDRRGPARPRFTRFRHHPSPCPLPCDPSWRRSDRTTPLPS
jgi:hypothetical protein